MNVNHPANLLDNWCSVPVNVSWRWHINNSKAINVIETTNLPKKDRDQANLGKVFASMNASLTGSFECSQAWHFGYLYQPNMQQALRNLKGKVIEKYTDYANKRPFLCLILEIFLSIFPGRVSAWSEKKKLIAKIDCYLGNIDLINTLEAQLDQVKRQLTPQGPCRIIASIYTDQRGRLRDNEGNFKFLTSRLWGINFWADKVYTANQDPREIIEGIKESIRVNISGKPINLKDLSFEFIQLTKANANHLNALHLDGNNASNFSNIAWDKKVFDSIVNQIHLPDEVLDNQGNFLPVS